MLWDHEATASETDAQGDAEYQGEKQYKLYSCCLRVDIKGSYPKGCNERLEDFVAQDTGYREDRQTCCEVLHMAYQHRLHDKGCDKLRANISQIIRRVMEERC